MFEIYYANIFIQTKSYFINEKSNQELALYVPDDFDDLKKDEDGVAKIRCIISKVLLKVFMAPSDGA